MKSGFVCFCSLLLTTTAYSSEVDTLIDTLVVTGSRATDQLAEIPNATTVISLEDLEARNSLSVVDAFRQLPGIHVVQPSGQGGVARIFVRGGDQILDSYTRLDMTASYRHTDALTAILSLTNLFDDNYYEAIGFPAPGIRLRVGLRYQF
jgi:outer membrane cobalamin receptor